MPKLYQNDQTKTIWEYLPHTKHLSNPNQKDLKEVANILSQIHLSKLKFPPNNLRQRVHAYLKIIHQKNIKVFEIENNYREMVSLLAKMRNNWPSHIDVWPQNLLKDDQQKIWLVDWEYSTMGDYYFDLAYLIQSANLNQAQEDLFLKTYFQKTSFEYQTNVLFKYKRFCNWLTILWAYCQPKMPFDTTQIKKFLNQKN